MNGCGGGGLGGREHAGVSESPGIEIARFVICRIAMYFIVFHCCCFQIFIYLF